MLFSATFEAQIKALALEFMRNPQQVQVAAQNTIAETITHRAHPVDGSRKRDLLIEILSKRHTDQVLVFGKTKHGCNRLSEQLEAAGLKSVAISSIQALSRPCALTNDHSIRNIGSTMRVEPTFSSSRCFVASARATSPAQM